MKGVIYLRTCLIAILQISVVPRTYAWEQGIALAKTHTESRWVESHLWEWNSSVRRKCSLCSLVCVSLWEKGWKFPWRWKMGFCTIFIDTDSRERMEMFREWHELNFSCMSIMIQCVTARPRHNCVVCRALYRYRFPDSIQMILIQFDANSFGCIFFLTYKRKCCKLYLYNCCIVFQTD